MTYALDNRVRDLAAAFGTDQGAQNTAISEADAKAVVADQKATDADARAVAAQEEAADADAKAVAAQRTAGLTPEMFGAAGDGVTDDTAAVQAAIESGHPVISMNGDYLISTRVNAVVSSPISINLAGRIISGRAPGFETEFVIRVSGGSNRHSVTVFGGGTIDASNRDDIPGTGSGSGLLIRNSNDAVISNVRFVAGGLGDGKGDSGLVLEYCQRVTVSDCFFSGWDDHDIYATGGATPISENSEGESLVVTGCHFENNRAGSIRLARDYKRIVASSNVAKNVGKLVVVAGGESNWTSASQVTISDNIIDGTSNCPIDLRWMHPRTGVVVIGNQIYDWASGIESPAIRILGASNAICSGNVIRPRLLVATEGQIACALGISISNGTGDDGIAYSSSNAHIFGNTIEVLQVSGLASPPLNFCIRDATGQAYIYDNLCLNSSPLDIQSELGTGVGNQRIRRLSSAGVGFSGAIPRAAMEVSGRMVVSRSNDPSRYVQVNMDSEVVARIDAVSPVSGGRLLYINSRTETSEAPTGGALGINLAINGNTRFSINNQGVIEMSGIASYVDDAEAATAGVPLSGLYVDSANGNLRVRKT